MCDTCDNESICRVNIGVQYNNSKSYCLSCLLDAYPKSAEVVA